jgi:hydrogenase maturation protein HypF
MNIETKPDLPRSDHRLRTQFTGVVQGVGFRPTLYRLATEIGLTGWIQNTGSGVLCELEGPRDALQAWLKAVLRDIPPPAAIDSNISEWLPPVGFLELQIRESISQGPRIAQIPADIAICADCILDMSSEKTATASGNRRANYPFTTCTQCGPRYSLIENIPFDRAMTTMRDFTMCEDCQSEYLNPLDRRFHSQTNCCPKCGPQYILCDRSGATLEDTNHLWELVKIALLQGKIVALKGLGGFQLVALASSALAVTTLRNRKQRPSKAFAIMFRSIDAAKKVCLITSEEEQLLRSQAAPIVLVSRRPQVNSFSSSSSSSSPSLYSALESNLVDPAVAPDTRRLGIMLPTTGAHVLLADLIDDPLILTSGNLSGEPICIDEANAFAKLGPIADLFLIHNRRILSAVDDSVVQLVLGELQILRRARGYSPLPISTPGGVSPTLALGAQFKNSIALQLNNNAFVSQHIGDLENTETYASFVQTCTNFQKVYHVTKPRIVCDLHPDYQSTQFANHQDPTIAPLRVQHHWAHALACAAEHKVQFPFLAAVWDGTGYGTDGTSWGGEFLRGERAGFTRFGHLRTFPLPGGDLAARQPRRSLAGILYELFENDAAIDPLFKTMMQKSVNSPRTSSMGRLFDGVAALLGLNSNLGLDSKLSYEGEAAIKLQNLAESADGTSTYSISIKKSREQNLLDWGPMIKEIILDFKNLVPNEVIARKFHFTLVKGLVEFALMAGEKRIILTGGCFQNQILLEATIQQLREKHFVVFWPQQIPPNDGGISLGQIMAAHLEES